MKTRPKLRTFFRWMLTILTVLIVVVWIGSGWYGFGCSAYFEAFNQDYSVDCDFRDGTFYMVFAATNSVRPGSYGIEWQFPEFLRSTMNYWLWDFDTFGPATFVAFPVWFADLLIAIPATLMWRTHLIDRRRKTGMCKKCGYDITGLMGQEACPECGTRIKSEIAPAKA